MTELLQASFSSINVIPTALLVFVLLYWVAVILGLLDLDFANIELEFDTEIDAEGLSSIAWLNSALAFFHLGKVPLMLFLTFVALPFWAIAVLGNYYLGTASSFVGFLLLGPNLLVSLLLAKVLTIPFVKLFATLEKEHDSNTVVIGQICTILLAASSTEIGQAAVKTKGAPLLLNVKATHGAELPKGATALVIDFVPESQLYLIEPYQTL